MTTLRPDARLDFPFTEADDPPARSRIERDLRHVVRRVAEADPHALALVLTGGFSRGEGTVRDGAPVNDYDLVAVRAHPGSGPLGAIAHELSEDVGLEVDLMPVWHRRLPLVGRKLFWLDLRLGGRAIAGDGTVLARVRSFEAPDLHPRERARLLGNRAAGLLLAVPPEGGPHDAHQRDLQATKAVLAAMDARLLHRGLYAARLRDRLALAADADRPLYETAVEWKLTGRARLPDDWWSLARDALLRAVDATHAAYAADGPSEHAFHLLRARRPALHPSQRVRREAWLALKATSWPQLPAGFDRAAFLGRRAKTLQ